MNIFCLSTMYKHAILFWMVVSVDAAVNAPEMILWKHLMSTTDYDRNLRPILDDPNKQINVDFFFSLARLESLNEKSQVMTTFGWMGMFWKDELLRWNPADFGGLVRLVVPAENIWLPEVAMMNSVEQGNDLSMTSKFRATIFADGTISWAPGFKWQTSCTVDLVTFPYDTQECNVTFVNWVYQAVQLNFSLWSDIVDLGNFEPNGEWDVQSAKASRMEFSPNPDLDMYVPTVTFTLSLKRKPAFFELNVVVPSMIMTLISALVFCLPAESGEKIGLGITVLLSYSVVLLMVSDITPRSNSMPLITMYIVINMGLTAVSLIGTVIILNVYHHNPLRSVPSWTRTAFFSCLTRCLCTRPGSQLDTAVHPATEPKSTLIGKGENMNDLKIEDLNGYNVKRAVQSHSDFRLPDEIQEFFKNAKEKEKENDIIEKNRADWQHLAATLDRLFFVLFCMVLVIVGVCVMGFMKKQAP